MDSDIENLRERITKIESRNQKVTIDKQWEQSLTRKIAIIVITYIIIWIYLWFIWVEEWYIHAIVPTIGFIISTLSIAFIKNIWIKRFIIK